MALDKATMAAYVKTAISAVDAKQFDSTNPVQLGEYRDAILEALCEGIIEEITTNAVVSIPSGSSAGDYGVS